MTERLLTTHQLARALNLSERTIQRYRQLEREVPGSGLTPEMETPGGQARWLESNVRDQLKAIAARRRET